MDLDKIVNNDIETDDHSARLNAATEGLVSLGSSNAPAPLLLDHNDDAPSEHDPHQGILRSNDAAMDQPASASKSISKPHETELAVETHLANQTPPGSAMGKNESPFPALLRGVEIYAQQYEAPSGGSEEIPEYTPVTTTAPTVLFAAPAVTDTASAVDEAPSEINNTADRDLADEPTPSVIPSASKGSSPAIETTEKEEPDGSSGLDVSTKPSKKRPAPKTKSAKGGATKKGPPAKKRKLDTTGKSKTAKGAAGKLGASAAVNASSPLARSAQSVSIEPDDVDDEDEAESDADHDEDAPADSDDEALYCICRKPDSGTVMIACENEEQGVCPGWFHRKCIGVTEQESNLTDKWYCSQCVEKSLGQITWKRLCRRPGCGTVARISTDQEDQDRAPPSKYCSEQCGVVMFEHMLRQARQLQPNGSVSSDQKKTKKSAQNVTEADPALGGLLSAAELKALVVSTSGHIAEFGTLGNGVLSPPDTPPNAKHDSTYDSLVGAQDARLAAITKAKDKSRARHLLLKDRIKFINSAKQAALQRAEAKGVKPKDLCGFDSRISWDDSEFQAWRNGVEGQEALASGTLLSSSSGTEGALDSESPWICAKKKCPRHTDWSRLSIESVRSDIVENSEAMAALDRTEREIRENIGVKTRALAPGNANGHVTHHSVEATPEPLDESRPVEGTDLEDDKHMSTGPTPGLTPQAEAPDDVEMVDV